jgi:hypothetical protein
MGCYDVYNVGVESLMEGRDGEMIACVDFGCVVGVESAEK